MVYNIRELLEDIDGHENTPNRQIKIKLADGTIKDIDGFEFYNVIVGGDDVIYIKEANPLKEEWRDDIKQFIIFSEKIMKVCEEEYERVSVDEDYDTSDILDIENEIAKLSDFYIKKCHLEKEVEKRYGCDYNVGAGDTDEVYAKINTLKAFIR